MRLSGKKYVSVPEYIADCLPAMRPKLKELRKIIRAAAPEAEEVISYNMPAYKSDGILVYFAPAKEHIGFYPTGSGVAAFKERLHEYVTSKGTIRLPLDQPLPADLIADVVRFRVEENRMKMAARKAKRSPKARP